MKKSFLKVIALTLAIVLSIAMTTSVFASEISAISSYNNERLQHLHELLESNGVERQRIATADIPPGVYARTFNSIEEYMDYLELISTLAAFQIDAPSVYVDMNQFARSGGGTWIVDSQSSPWFLGGGTIYLIVSVHWSGGRITAYSTSVARSGLHLSNLHVNTNIASLTAGGSAVQATAAGSFAEFLLIPGTPWTEIIHHPWSMWGILHVFTN